MTTSLLIHIIDNVKTLKNPAIHIELQDFFYFYKITLFLLKIEMKDKIMENNHIVPDNVKSDYHTFIKWCIKNNIKEIGHTVAPLASSKLRCKPINIEEFSENMN